MTTWAVLLAGGNGSRMKSLTTRADGTFVPKQYCSLGGGPSLIQRAMMRAHGFACADEVVVVVAEQHRAWHAKHLPSVAPASVLEQPYDRGTGHGVLLALLHILRHDPLARLVVLPADQVIVNEAQFAASLAAAVREPAGEDAVILLAVEPDEPDTDMGYILPGVSATSGPARVVKFVEKPAQAQANDLIAQGALWNSSVIVASVRVLLSLFGVEFAFTIANLQKALDHGIGDHHDAAALRSLYSQLPTTDFSEHILQHHVNCLRVITMPDCGWTDLGTPAHVARALASQEGIHPGGEFDDEILDLALQYHRFATVNAAAGGARL